MQNSQRFNFTEKLDAFGVPDQLPQLPLTLLYRNASVEGTALLDTGSSVNLLPYNLGIALGAVWQEQTTSVVLTGILNSVEARGLIVLAQIGTFEPVRLVFAWSRSDDAPLLLGRINFFSEFDVCFYQSQLMFEIRTKSPPSR